MHHGTCVTHVLWCMSGSLARGGRKNVPGISSACATRNFTYLVRGPWVRSRPLKDIVIHHPLSLTEGITLYVTYVWMEIGAWGRGHWSRHKLYPKQLKRIQQTTKSRLVYKSAALNYKDTNHLWMFHSISLKMGLVVSYVNIANIGSGNSLLADITRPLIEPMHNFTCKNNYQHILLEIMCKKLLWGKTSYIVCNHWVSPTIILQTNRGIIYWFEVVVCS